MIKSNPRPAIDSTVLVAGMRVRCIDDQGWLVPDPGFEHLAPKKGNIYTVREYERFGSCGAISLMEGNPDNFYRAVRFKPVTAT